MDKFVFQMRRGKKRKKERRERVSEENNPYPENFLTVDQI